MAWHANFETYHIPHKASLKAKLLLEIKKYAFYLFLGKWDIAFGSPCRVRLTASGILGFAKVAEIGCRRAPAVEIFCGRNQVLAIDITVRVGLACRSGIGRAIDGTERAIGAINGRPKTIERDSHGRNGTIGEVSGMGDFKAHFGSPLARPAF
jgi:hypothetical protein